MSLSKNAIAYVRAVPGLSIEDQEDDAKAFGCREIYRHGEHGKQMDMRHEFIMGLGTGRDTVAWVARLDVLLKRKSALPAKTMPTRDFAVALAGVAAKASEVVEGATGITSNRGADWANRVSWAMHKATGGTPRNLAKQREHGRKSGKIARDKSIRVKWASRRYVKQRQDAARIWRDTTYATREEARAALPYELQGLSLHTLWKLFGARDPKIKGRGRPKAT